MSVNIDFSHVAEITIPEGYVMKIEDDYGNIIWEKSKKESYTDLQYITASGTQYIDTGYKASQSSITVEVDASVSSVSVTNFYICWSTNYAMRFSRAGARYAAYCKYNSSSYGNAGTQKTLPLSQSTFTLNYNGFFINGSRVAQRMGGSYGTDDSIKIFDEGMSGNIYGVILSGFPDAASPVITLSPVVRDSDGVAGLYDWDNDIFYASAGSSDFIAGPYL